VISVKAYWLQSYYLRQINSDEVIFLWFPLQEWRGRGESGIGDRKRRRGKGNR
jgi:hypothetical protein